MVLKTSVSINPSQRIRHLSVFASFSGAGGVERMLINLVRGMVDQGVSVDLVMVRTDSPHLAELPAQVRLVRLRATHTLLAVPELARYLRARRPAVLLVAKDRAGRAAVLARMLAGIDTRILVRLGTTLSSAMAERSSLSRWLRYKPIRLLYPHIDRIIAVSEGVAEDTARIARIARARITVIRNPVITPQLYAGAAAPCPHPWLAAGEPPVILAAGRLQRQKDFPTLIRAFAQVRALKDCRLMILGEGAARPRLEALVSECALNKVVAMPGFQANPYAFLSRAALFVLSSAWEGSPNVLTEAMALGIPVVATDCPSGPAEILDGGRYGPLVAVGDAAGLAQAMLAMLAKPTPAAMVQGAVAQYTQSRSVGRYLDVLGLGA